MTEPALDKDPPKHTSVIVFDKQKKIRYFGGCKMSIIRSECLQISIDDEAKTEFTETFNRRFFAVENLICVSNLLTKRNIILITQSRETSQNTVQYINETKPEHLNTLTTLPGTEENIFKDDFFIPLWKEIQNGVTRAADIKKIIMEVVNAFDSKKREFYLRLALDVALDPSSDVVGTRIKVEPTVPEPSAALPVVDNIEIKSEIPRTDAATLDATVSDDDNAESSAAVLSMAVLPMVDHPVIKSEPLQADDTTLNDADDLGLDETADTINSNELNISTSSLRKRRNVDYNDDYDFSESDDEEYRDPSLPSSSKKRRSVILPKKEGRFTEVKQGFSSVALNSSNYEIVEFVEGQKLKKRLLLFTSKDRPFCFQYSYSPYHGSWYCLKCNPNEHFVTVKIAVDDDGEQEFIFGRNKHRCQPIPYMRENYQSTKIIRPPEFEVIQRPSRKGSMVQRIIVFANDDKTTCYEYTDSDKGFYCMKCVYKHKYVSAKLIKDAENGDQLELSRAQHICEPQKYIPIDTSANKTVQKPYFKIFTYPGTPKKETQILKIFDVNDMSLFYEYYYSDSFKCFICKGCTKKQVHRKVTAKVCYADDEKKYLELSKMEHICSMKKKEEVDAGDE